MQRSLFRTSTRFVLQSSSRRFISSGRTISSKYNYSSRWAAAGLTTVGTLGYYMLSNPIFADAEGKEYPAEAKDAKVVIDSTQAKAEPKEKAQPTEDDAEDAGQAAAYDPVTGEINWDCPCLGGMAHGPCGEEFKEAFSCFIYSEAEPKGIDCIERFKNMQNCFRKYPDIYSEELRDEDEPQQETTVEVSEDSEGNIVSDEVTVTKDSEDGFVAVDEKISIDLRDLDEFVKDGPAQN